jgi:hypothetical protein
MSRFKFQVLRDSTPQEWLRVWAGWYQRGDDPKYRDLIAKYKSLSAEDFEEIGKWKDDAKTERRWKPNVASVACEIWRLAAKELPKCPKGSEVAAFLDVWSRRPYTDVYKNGPMVQRFGLPARPHYFTSSAEGTSLPSTHE